MKTYVIKNKTILRTDNFSILSDGQIKFENVSFLDDSILSFDTDNPILFKNCNFSNSKVLIRNTGSGKIIIDGINKPNKMKPTTLICDKIILKNINECFDKGGIFFILDCTNIVIKDVNVKTKNENERLVFNLNGINIKISNADLTNSALKFNVTPYEDGKYASLLVSNSKANLEPSTSMNYFRKINITNNSNIHFKTIIKKHQKEIHVESLSVDDSSINTFDNYESLKVKSKKETGKEEVKKLLFTLNNIKEQKVL